MIQAHIRGETEELQSHAALSCVVGAEPCPPPPRASFFCFPPPSSLEISPGSHHLLPFSCLLSQALGRIPIAGLYNVRGPLEPLQAPIYQSPTVTFPGHFSLGSHYYCSNVHWELISQDTLLLLEFRGGSNQQGDSWGWRLLSRAYRPYLQGSKRYEEHMFCSWEMHHCLVLLSHLWGSVYHQQQGQLRFPMEMPVWPPRSGTPTQWRDAGPASL